MSSVEFKMFQLVTEMVLENSKCISINNFSVIRKKSTCSWFSVDASGSTLSRNEFKALKGNNLKMFRITKS